MRARWIWSTALALYAGFWLWYVGLQRPLAPAEIDAHLAAIEGSDLHATPEQLAAMRAFLEADDGREFFMLNLLQIQPGPVVPPGGGAPRPPREVMDVYTRRYMPALLRRAGHPVFLGRAAGRYLEQWNVAPDPGWSFGGVIRYRSRRDLVELVTDPRFADAHAFKAAALAATLAFPIAPGVTVFGPVVWVALAIALLAALAQIALGAARER